MFRYKAIIKLFAILFVLDIAFIIGTYFAYKGYVKYIFL